MKKYLNLALIYGIAALAGGVFFREFTKFNGFAGATVLGGVHVHLFALGVVWYLLIALFADRCPLQAQKSFRVALPLYNIGLPFTAIMMLVRGTLQVLGTALTPGADAAIAGIAGLGHIATGTALVLFLLALCKAAPAKA